MAKPDDKDPIERLSERLYDPDGPPPPHEASALHRATYGASRDWNHQEDHTFSYEAHRNFFKRFFMVSAAFFVISALFAFYMLYGGGNILSNDKIGLAILGPAFTEGGNEFELEFDVRNGNAEGLEYAELVIEYPKGATLEGDKDTVRLRKFLGALGAGESASEKAAIVLFGEEGSERTVKATLEYRVKGSNAIFLKEASYLVHIKSSPIVLSASAPEKVSSGQEFALAVDTVSNADKVVENLLIRVEYPAGFIFKSSTPKPTYGNNIWRLGDLTKGTKKTVTLHGTLQGENGGEYSFRTYVGAADAEDEQEIGVVYNSMLKSIVIDRPFLEAKLSLADQGGESATLSSNSTVSGTIELTNNLPNRVLDLGLEVRLIGATLDKNSVTANGGFWNSSEGVIVWTNETYGKFSFLDGGARDTLSFSFKLLPLFSANKVLFKNPEFTVQVAVRGRRVLENNLVEDISASDTKALKVNSNVQFSSRTLYYDGQFTNTGGVPPKAERETTYTVNWTLLNSSNDLSNATVKTKLPSYMRWVGSVAPSSEGMTYNTETREISWELGRVKQGVGVESAPRQVSFQIGLTPSLSQVGTQVSLTGDIVVTALDAWSGGTVSLVRSALTTRLVGDSGAKPGDDIIVK
ncbi:hypothetical protein KW797_03215 [Candidatus Parcubacteria bacterium]|nr:hypothetical protein [Candidatus Parcubacteria bacterium]